MPHERYVRASDIGTHSFCGRALALKDAGAPTTLMREQQEGIAFHDAHGARVRSSNRNRKLATLLILTAIALPVVAWLLH